MEIFLSTLQNLGVAVLTLLIFTLWKSQGAILSAEFVWSVFWNENKKRWLYVLSLILSLIIARTYFPGSIDTITGFMGIKLTEGPGAWATIAVLILTTTKGVGKKATTKRKELVDRNKKVSSIKG